jgi:hypothetical protein
MSIKKTKLKFGKLKSIIAFVILLFPISAFYFLL